MSIEELATMLGEQLRAAEEAAWDEGYLVGTLGWRGENAPNPYRTKVSA